MKNETGQVILILVLVMTVALAIGISVIQRSVSDISTSSKVEQSSRAFSAAEAGIEAALNAVPASTTLPSIALSNNAQAQAADTGLIPAVAAVGSRQVPLEYPPLSKEEVAQVWLADPNSATDPPAGFYKQTSLDVYWGDSSSDTAALELTLVYHDGSQYQTRKWYLDQVPRNPANNFELVTCTGNYSALPGYQCEKTINLPASPASLMLLRARLLYNVSSQPFAVQAIGTCGTNCSLPPQARIVTSTGTAGTTQRKVQLFQISKVVPSYFDFAIFSIGAINK